MSVTPNKHGYVKTRVNNKRLTIKDSQRGTGASSTARRLLTDERVRSAKVDHDGSVKVYVKSPEKFNFGYGNGLLPDGWTVTQMMVHPRSDSKGSAHVTIEQE